MGKCPGSDSLRGVLEVTYKVCPDCGRELEIMSCAPTTTCECGFVAYSNMASCLKWCAHAKDCVGEKAYYEFMRRYEDPDAEKGLLLENAS